MKSPKDSGSLLYMLWFGTFNMPEGGLQVETAHRKKARISENPGQLRRLTSGSMVMGFLRKPNGTVVKPRRNPSVSAKIS